MSLSIIEKSMPSRKQCSRQSSRCSPSCSRANIRGVARRLWTVWNPPFILVDSVFDATVPRLMDFVYDTLKRVTLAAKEVIDETAAQSKSAILRNALATGRLNSRDIRLSLQYGINFFLRASEKEQLKSVIIKHEFTSVTRRLFQPLPQGAVGHPGVRHACSVDDSNCVVPIDVPAFELDSREFDSSNVRIRLHVFVYNHN
ncbi:hypothetical protein ACOME3_003611 [Neoechinorhynchus agilis]